MPMTRPGCPRSPARNPVVVKMPTPIMFDTTSAVALVVFSWRTRLDGGIEVGCEELSSTLDEFAIDGVLGDALPLLRPVLRQDLYLGVDDVRIPQDVGARFCALITEFRFDDVRLAGLTRRQTFRAGDRLVVLIYPLRI